MKAVCHRSTLKERIATSYGWAATETAGPAHDRDTYPILKSPSLSTTKLLCENVAIMRWSMAAQWAASIQLPPDM